MKMMIFSLRMCRSIRERIMGKWGIIRTFLKRGNVLKYKHANLEPYNSVSNLDAVYVLSTAL